MPNSCTVCMNNSGRNKDISFFSYPRNHVQRQEWLQVVGRQDLIEKLEGDKARRNYRICQQHFETRFIKFSKHKTVKYLTENAYPTLNLPTNADGASTSISQHETITAIDNQICENISASTSSSQYEAVTAINNQIKILSDQTSCSDQDDLLVNARKMDGCESRCSQTAFHLSADTPRKRKLSLELREAKKSKTLDLNNVTTEDFLKLCENFLIKNMTQLIKWQIDLKMGCRDNRFPRNVKCRELWREIVAMEQGEELYTPMKSSDVCSEHYLPTETYISKMGMTMKKKSADPRITPMVSDQSSAQQSPSFSELDSLQEGLELDTAKSLFFNDDEFKVLRKRLEIKCEQVKILKRQNNRLKIKTVVQKERNRDLTKKIFANEAIDEELLKDLKKILISRRKTPFSRYPQNVRKFAVMLHFYSHSAFKLLRLKSLEKSPRLSEPEFSRDTLSILADKASSSTSAPLLCSLIAGEIAIQQETMWTSIRHEALADMGVGFNEYDGQMASQAYVFLLVSLDQSWTLPIAYFFVQSLCGEIKANLINITLKKCHDVGVKVVSVTFEGSKSNFHCMQMLGCNLDNHAHMKTTFKHPCADYEVAVLLDACHVLKLVQNTLESTKIIYDGTDGIVKWQHILSLHNLKQESYLQLANKFTLRHIKLRNELMHVKTTQSLRNSVANAIELCSKEIKTNAFDQSDATVKFIKLVKNLFDILNSRNLEDVEFKLPLCHENASKVLSFCDSAKNYLLTLKTNEKLNKNEFQSEIDWNFQAVYQTQLEPLHKSKISTGIIGLLICINSLQHLYSTLIETNVMPHLKMYKFSQDHLEIFFGKIRSQGSYNNKPNARQFKFAYKKIVSRLELGSISEFSGIGLNLEKSSNGTSTNMQNINCNSFKYGYEDEKENEENLSKVLKQYRFIDKHNTEEKYRNNCDLLSKSLQEVRDVTKPIIGYISGVVVYNVLKNLHCKDCKHRILATEKKWFHKLIDIKDLGVCFVSDNVFMICSETEKCVKRLLNLSGKKTVLTQYNKMFITTKVMRSLLDTDLLKRTDAHSIEQFNHVYDLTKAIIETYVDVRLHKRK